MARKKESIFDKMMVTKTRLAMYARYGEQALQGQSPQDFAKDVNECMDHLMSFRNIVNGMVSFDEAPEQAALFYIPTDLIEKAASQ